MRAIAPDCFFLRSGGGSGGSNCNNWKGPIRTEPLVTVGKLVRSFGSAVFQREFGSNSF